MLSNPTIITVTPAFPLALFVHLKDVWANEISKLLSKMYGHNKPTCSP